MQHLIPIISSLFLILTISCSNQDSYDTDDLHYLCDRTVSELNRCLIKLHQEDTTIINSELKNLTLNLIDSLKQYHIKGAAIYLQQFNPSVHTDKNVSLTRILPNNSNDNISRLNMDINNPLKTLLHIERTYFSIFQNIQRVCGGFPIPEIIIPQNDTLTLRANKTYKFPFQLMNHQNESICLEHVSPSHLILQTPTYTNQILEWEYEIKVRNVLSNETLKIKETKPYRLIRNN